MSNKLFYALSFTWGLPMSCIGALAHVVLSAEGNESKLCGQCLHYEIGEDWGGVTLGDVIITQRNAPESLLRHEHGHAIQNCIYGPLMPFLVCIPSVIRYWWRKYTRSVNPQKELPPYDAAWFEAQATKFGKDIEL